jgi:hypothetical protein
MKKSEEQASRIFASPFPDFIFFAQKTPHFCDKPDWTHQKSNPENVKIGT